MLKGHFAIPIYIMLIVFSNVLKSIFHWFKRHLETFTKDKL